MVSPVYQIQEFMDHVVMTLSSRCTITRAKLEHPGSKKIAKKKIRLFKPNTNRLSSIFYR